MILKKEKLNYLIQISAQSWVDVHCMILYMCFDFKKSERKWKLKDGKMLRIAEAKIKDQTRVIKFTLFHDLIDKVKEDTGYSMMYLRLGK